MVSGHGHPYGYPRPLSRYMDICTDIRADIHVELSVLRTVQPGVLPVAYTSVCGNAPVSLDFSHLPLDEWSTRSCRFSRGDWQCEAG